MKNFNDAVWKENVSQVIKIIQENDIKFVRLQFTDINGMLKNLAVSSKNIENIFENGQSFDGSSITGYQPIEESDMVLYPDPTTFAILPWRSKEKASCRLLCDIYTPQNKRYDADPRYILEKTLEKARQAGYKFICAPELEFFIVKESENGGLPTPIDLSGYFDFHPGDLTDDLRREIADTAEAFGIDIELSHHESALGQNEIDFKYGEALETADRAITLKMCGKVVAARAGYIATYMPKPFQGINGSGMHTHQSLWSLDGKTNMFYAEDAEHGYLSKTAKNFIGGQLNHGRKMCAILNSWPNSYKRLVPGYEAPVYIAWAHKNRSPLIRVPNFGARKTAARCEIRCPDGAGNPYLQFAALLATGLDGIQNKTDPGDPIELNVYHMSYEERKERKIVSLPESLKEALDEFETSDLMKETLGETAFENFLKEKRREWDTYRLQVTEWEVNRYIKRL
ncbi:MAG: glutamine synthetase family protein [Candidatus Bathyarchaeota archaeon]|nr:glutamine synthetase family protein [Candidatus Termiticorpusculum sp.]MCL2868915.1 glutamine synthetase family protein [Candidatus Termiticorpusculum sp.]